MTYNVCHFSIAFSYDASDDSKILLQSSRVRMDNTLSAGAASLIVHSLAPQLTRLCPAQSELESKLMSKLRDAYCSEATSIIGRVRALAQ